MTLREAFKDDFLIGAAVHPDYFAGEDAKMGELVQKQYNSIAPKNILKWSLFNPKPGVFNHQPADEYVEWGNKHGMYVVGHVLFWHAQTPEWVFQDADGKPISRDALLARMRERVRHVANRYGDKIHAWDVVNESIMGDGSLRKSPWTQIIGDDFIEQAFRIADEELPKNVELIYNDYSMEGKAKREAVVKLIGTLKAKGIRIDGVGSQSHFGLNGPPVEAIDATIAAFVDAGVKVHISELDVDVLPRKGPVDNADVNLKEKQDPALDPYRDGLPDDVQQKLAERYAAVFQVFLKHRDGIKRVTLWGVCDRDSWKNNHPIKGRTNHPLLFDRQLNPKPAFDAVLKVAESTPRSPSPAGE